MTAALENRLILHVFLCREFGYDSMDAMLDQLRAVSAGFAPGRESEYARALYLSPERSAVSPEQLGDYDAAIAKISRQLRLDGDHGRRWKPHQYLAILFSEHYLRRYFDDPEKLCSELNAAKERGHLTSSIPDYAIGELSTIAMQSATGSGKTLIMQANILQYTRLAEAAGSLPNNIILVTPNEQLSAQHERELLANGIPCRMFAGEAEASLLAPVEIIDLNKLAEKKGVKRVAVSDFGENNLVLVDEGHLGASGQVWRKRRTELARSGFAFEYSATFNQIASNDSNMRDTYGKCLLFNYSYRSFYDDGYGKDYAISNLPQGNEDENSSMYLLGCLLNFYQQCLIWEEERAGWRRFNIAKPLWMFIGKTVTGRTQSDEIAKSDVVSILCFLGWVLARKEQICPMIDQLLGGKSGLVDAEGNDYFAGRFEALKGIQAKSIYDDVCRMLFHGHGKMRVVHLVRGEGELHLRTSDNAPFGVVNIGDSAALYRMLNERGYPDLVLEQDMGFARPLFADVDREDSTVNIVIGARRFIAGWNSWRVSTMGLMHVGVCEGPEIIQMFGRGIRLRGWNMSLKRHRECDTDPPANSHLLQELETLHVFGLRSNYMQVFRDFLQMEGINIERKTIALPVFWNFAKKGLKIIRLKSGVKYENSRNRLALPSPGHDSRIAEINLYSKLQAAASTADTAAQQMERISVKIAPEHVAMFNRTRIYDKLLARKRAMGWHNLEISMETVEKLLMQDGWYELYAPPEKIAVESYGNIKELEDIVVELISEYASIFWQAQRARWERGNIEVIPLDESDPNNIREYRLSVDAARIELVEKISVLSSNPREAVIDKIGLVMTDIHAYKPLLYATGRGEITVQPVPLNIHENKVVQGLIGLAKQNDPCLKMHELFLIRNLTRGRGVSFFNDYSYYPDFIVWLKNDRKQHMLFLDPKGLMRFGSNERKKVQLHNDIKNLERQIRQDNPDLHLHAYILSTTKPDRIGSERPRPQKAWESQGVYFLKDRDWPKRIFRHVLGA